MPRNDPVLLAIERFVLCEEVGIPNGLLNEERLGPNLPQMLDHVLPAEVVAGRGVELL